MNTKFSPPSIHGLACKKMFVYIILQYYKKYVDILQFVMTVCPCTSGEALKNIGL